MGDEANDCDDGLVICSAGACVYPDGTICSDNQECANTCIFSNCTGLSALGQGCDDTGDCAGAGPVCFNNECLLPNGFGCSSNNDCINTCISGTCRDLSGANGDCDPSDDLDCDAGQCISNECLLPDLLPCTNNNQCINTCIFGFCSPRAPFFSACDPGDHQDCLDSSLQCVGTGVCLYANDQSCSSNFDCVNVCVANNCTDVGSLFSACDASENDDCSFPLECSSTSVCLKPQSENCVTNDECIQVCVDGACSAPSLLDDPCDEDADCQSPLLCNDVVCVQCLVNQDCLQFSFDACIVDTCANFSDVGEPCDETADCASNLLCNGQVCKECLSNSDCSGGDVCIFEICSNISDQGGSCDETADCIPGQNLLCVSGTCTPRTCTANAQCDQNGQGQTCIFSHCDDIQSLHGSCDDSDDCATSACANNECVSCVVNAQCESETSLETCIFHECTILSGIYVCDASSVIQFISVHTAFVSQR